MEPDLFSRQTAMTCYDQGRLEGAHIGVVGCGGLGSWIGLGLARMGVRRLTLVDPDAFDRTNAPRQFMAAQDLGRPKAIGLAGHLVSHMTNGGSIHAVVGAAEEADTFLREASGLVVGVDNNRTRLAVARAAQRWQVPVVFAMLSRDGLRAQAFLQRVGGPCLSCVLPNLDPDLAAPCAAASITSCFLIAGHAVHMLTAEISRTATVTWREVSLDGSRDSAGRPTRRNDCPTCGPYAPSPGD